MLCRFLLYGKVMLLYVYILFPILFHYAYHKILNTVPCGIQLDFIVYPYNI